MQRQKVWKEEKRMSEEIWNQIYHYAQGKSERCIANDRISPRLYEEYGVNLGLRDEDVN